MAVVSQRRTTDGTSSPCVEVPSSVHYLDWGACSLSDSALLSARRWESRRIISKVTLPHFSVLQRWWLASIYAACPPARSLRSLRQAALCNISLTMSAQSNLSSSRQAWRKKNASPDAVLTCCCTASIKFEYSSHGSILRFLQIL